MPLPRAGLGEFGQLVDAGKLTDALRRLSAAETSRGLSSIELIWKARLLSLTGQLPEASRIATGYLEKQHQPSTQRGVAFEILGHAAFKRGNYTAGVAIYQRGLQEAVAAGETPIAAHLQVRLLRKIAHYLGPHRALPLTGTTRRLVLQAGEPGVSLEFQLALAELEAKRGLAGHATRLVSSARALLELAPDAILEAELLGVELAQSALSSELDTALGLASRAFDIAQDSGSSALHFASAVNLGHLLIAAGDLERASSVLTGALDLHAVGGGTEIAIRDTLAEIALANLDGPRFNQQSALIERLVDTPEAADTVFALWHCLTRMRWLIRTKRASEAVALAEDALPRIERMADRNMIERMQLLTAEALALTGRANDGAALHADAVLRNPNPSLEMLAEAARVGGGLAALADPGAAFSAFARAGRILGVLGHRTALREVAANAAAALAGTSLSPAAVSAWLDPDAVPAATGPLPPARTGHNHLPDPRPAAAHILDAVAALLDLAGHPPLLGRELLDLLADTGSAPDAVLAEQAGQAAWRPVAWGARTPPERAAAIAVDPAAVVLPLGIHRDHAYAVLAPPALSPAGRATLLAVERVLRGATSLHQAELRERERAALWPEPSAEAQLGMVFAAESMVDLVKTTRRVATANVTVLITGETGTGKELLARALHEASARREKPFVPFNCTAVARDMLDSQLFGYRRGAFTGAHEPFDGVIRAAAGGTLFLDEIGEIGLDVQPKLLRFLESGEVHPLGEARPLPVDVRIVAATNAPLEELVADGRFREDLYYRLNIVRLQVPPLRERREEIPLLVEHFLDLWSREYQKAGLRLANETMEYLVLYPWPGNVRQLANELRRMAALAEPRAVLMPEHLSPEIAGSRRTLPASERDLAPVELVIRMDQPLSAAIEHLERALIGHAMDATGARVDDAARLLGLSRKGLYLKRQRLGLA